MPTHAEAQGRPGRVAGFAFALGYIKALIQAVDADGLTYSQSCSWRLRYSGQSHRRLARDALRKTGAPGAPGGARSLSAVIPFVLGPDDGRA